MFYKNQNTDYQTLKTINNEDHIAFNSLKKEVAQAFLKNQTASNIDISRWKGQDIVLFQEDLQQKTKASISEKSFYSYFKNSSEKLPRIDILNILSQYCGYQNWGDFKSKHQTHIAVKEKKFLPVWFWSSIVISGLIVAMYAFWPKTNAFHFCFMDQDRDQPITKTPIDIVILNDKESPFYLKSDKNGCFKWETKDEYIRFAVHSPYHKSDTIYRSIRTKAAEHIQLETDDYALMLYYYANGNIEDWQNRRIQLSKMIANRAIILQVLPHGLGVEVYTKERFINTLTTPTQSLQKIEVISSKKIDEQVVKLKFKVRS